MTFDPIHQQLIEEEYMDRFLLRDGGGVVLSGDSTPAQLLVEEAAEDVTSLGHRAANSLQQQEPTGRELSSRL